MLPGDVIFETGSDATSKAVIGAQKVFCSGKGDPNISHASLLIFPFLIMEADPAKNIHFRIMSQADMKDITYIYRRRQILDIQNLFSAISTLFGEKYSYFSILTSRLNIVSDVHKTFGRSFCSGLVKKILNIADGHGGLSDNLLLSPCELHYEISRAPDWHLCDKRNYDILWTSGSAHDILHESAHHMATALNTQINQQLNIAIYSIYLSSLVEFYPKFDYPFDIVAVAANISVLRQIGEVLNTKHWSIKQKNLQLNAILDRIMNTVLEETVSLSSNFPKCELYNNACKLCIEIMSEIENHDQFSCKYHLMNQSDLLSEYMDKLRILPVNDVISIYQNCLRDIHYISLTSRKDKDDIIHSFITKSINIRLSCIDTINNIEKTLEIIKEIRER